MIACGAMLGVSQPIILHLFGTTARSLEGLKAELMDVAFPLLLDVIATTDIEKAFSQVDIAIMVGGAPRKPGMVRKDELASNAVIYANQGRALEKYARGDVKVLMVANPVNTNALILKEHAPSLPPENITCLTRLDQNRALAQIAQRCGVHHTDIRNVVVWGNHSPTQYPDAQHGTIRGQPIREVVGDDEWLEETFVKAVQQRGDAIIKLRGKSSVPSAASAACDHMRDWLLGTPEGTWVSMGVVSDGSYGVPRGLVHSFPVTCHGGRWTIVQGLPISKVGSERLRVTKEELLEERDVAMGITRGMKKAHDREGLEDMYMRKLRTAAQHVEREMRAMHEAYIRAT